MLSLLLFLFFLGNSSAKLGESLHDRRLLYPVLRFYGSQPTQLPLERCEGDCDQDSDWYDNQLHDCLSSFTHTHTSLTHLSCVPSDAAGPQN